MKVRVFVEKWCDQPIVNIPKEQYEAFLEMSFQEQIYFIEYELNVPMTYEIVTASLSPVKELEDE